MSLDSAIGVAAVMIKKAPIKQEKDKLRQRILYLLKMKEHIRMEMVGRDEPNE